MQNDTTTPSAILRPDVSLTENDHHTRRKPSRMQQSVQTDWLFLYISLYELFCWAILVWGGNQLEVTLRNQLCAAEPQLPLSPSISLRANTTGVPVNLSTGITVLSLIEFIFIVLQNSELKTPGNALSLHVMSMLLSFCSPLLYHASKAEGAVDPRYVVFAEAFFAKQASYRFSLLLATHYYFRLRDILDPYRGDPERTTARKSFAQALRYAITSIDPVPINVTGHFNDIFLGSHGTFGQVALRRPRISESNYADAIRMFHREANAWNSLRHPCILPFLGTFSRDGHIYFVSPFAENGNLLEYVADRPQVNRIRLLCGVAHAIVYLHSRGIVHGDIKASNVLINSEGCPLLCDFGLVKMPGINTSIERKGAGSLRWQSSELWFNGPRSSASDTYAFAMTIVETLTGDVPFASLNNEVAVMLAVVAHDERPSTTPLASPTGVSYENAWAVAVSCWPKLPQDRIPMAEALWRLRADPSLAIDSAPRLQNS